MYTGTLVEFLGVGGGELMLILVVVLLLFGGKKLPELARGLGKGLRDFKDASDGVKREIHRNINEVGLTDEINDFKSVLTGDSSRPNNYDYKPGEQSEISKSYDGGSGYNDEAAHFNSTEPTDTEHTANAKNVESVENGESVDHTENAKNAKNVESVENAKRTEPVTHVDHNEHIENRNG